VSADALAGEVVEAAIALLTAIRIVDEILDADAGVAARPGDPELFADQMAIAGEKLVMATDIAHIAFALAVYIKRGKRWAINGQVYGIVRHFGGEFHGVAIIGVPAFAAGLVKYVGHWVSHAGRRAS